MKQTNFLFVDIVSSLFLAFLLISNFLGLLYITDGSIAFSAIGGIVIVIFYYFLVGLLKQNKEDLYKKRFMHFSLVFVILFVAISMVSFILMSHFINIEYNCKNSIKESANKKLDLTDSLLTIYKIRSTIDLNDLDQNLKLKLTSYKTTPNDNILKSELEIEPYNVKRRILNNPSSIDVDMVTTAIMAPKRLKIEKNIENLDTNTRLNTVKLRRVFNNWDRMSLVSAYDKLNAYVINTKKSVDKLLGELAFDKSPTELVLDNSKLPLNNPSKLSKKFAPDYTIPIIFILITHFLILVPVFFHNIRRYKTPNPIKQSKGSINL
jgi:hypothetical protein